MYVVQVISCHWLNNWVLWSENLGGGGSDAFDAQHQYFVTTGARHGALVSGVRCAVATIVHRTGRCWPQTCFLYDRCSRCWYAVAGVDGPVSVAAGDIDGDFAIDVAVAGVNDGSLTWYRNMGSSGAGVFAGRANVSTWPCDPEL